MNKFVESHELLKLTLEKKENPNRSVTSKEIEWVIKNLSTKTNLGSGYFTDEFY